MGSPTKSIIQSPITRIDSLPRDSDIESYYNAYLSRKRTSRLRRADNRKRIRIKLIVFSKAYANVEKYCANVNAGTVPHWINANESESGDNLDMNRERTHHAWRRANFTTKHCPARNAKNRYRRR